MVLSHCTLNSIFRFRTVLCFFFCVFFNINNRLSECCTLRANLANKADSDSDSTAYNIVTDVWAVGLILTPGVCYRLCVLVVHA